MREFDVYTLKVAYYIHYYFKSPTSDFLSGKILDFKSGNRTVVEIYTRIVLQRLKDKGLDFDFVVRALGHDEVVATKSPLCQIALAIQKEIGAVYEPKWIKKTHVTESLKPYGKNKRQEILNDVYYLDCNDDLNGKRILIIDDVATTGSSLSAIANAILLNNKAEVYGICLAHTMSYDFNGVSTNEIADVEEFQRLQKELSSEGTKK